MKRKVVLGNRPCWPCRLSIMLTNYSLPVSAMPTKLLFFISVGHSCLLLGEVKPMSVPVFPLIKQEYLFLVFIFLICAKLVA